MPAAPFLALITPIGDGVGSPGPQPPLGIWGPTDPRPSNPIYWPGYPKPPTVGGGPVDPGYSPPWAQVPPGTGPGGPVDPGYSPPWAQVPPGFPPGYKPPYVDNTLPGNLPYPSHPIYIPIEPPPNPETPGVPTHPIYIPVYPSHPIVIPPGTSAEEIKQKIIEAVEFWTGNLPTDPNAPPVPTPV